MIAPEVLDAHRLQEWLAGSVWALIGLNVIALGLFLTALVAPQIRSIKEDIASKFKALRDWRAAKKQAQLAAQQAAAAKIQEAQAQKAAEEAALEAEQKSRKISEDGLPSIATAVDLPPPPPPPPPPVAAPPAAVPTPPPSAPPPVVTPPPSVTAPAPEKAPMEAFGVDEKTEILDTSQIDELLQSSALEAPAPVSTPAAEAAPAPAPKPSPPPVAAAPVTPEFSWATFESSLGNLEKIIAEAEAGPAPDKTEPMVKPPEVIYSEVDKAAAAEYLASIRFSWEGFEKSLDTISNERPKVSDKTEEIPRPNLSPLPPAAVSAEKVATPMGAAAFEESLDELLKTGAEKTEELPIFNTQAIEDALKGVLDEDGPR